MTNISKHKITSEDYKRIETEFSALLAKLNKQTSAYLISELLTESERIMLIKRFGAVFMYSQAYTPYRVSVTLGLSAPTAYRLYEQYQHNTFNNLLSCLTKKEQSRFLSFLNDLIAAQASPRARARLMNAVSK